MNRRALLLGGASVLGFSTAAAQASLLLKGAGKLGAAAPEYSSLSASQPVMIGLGSRNGEVTARSITGPVLTSWLGDGRSGGGAGAAGAIAFRVRMQPGGFNSLSSSLNSTITAVIAGTTSVTGSRHIGLSYVCEASTATALRSRLCFFGKDFANTYLGEWDGAGAGSVGTARYLRTPVIKTDASGTFNGLAVLKRDAAGLFTVLLCYPDGTVEVGDTFTPATWIGIQTLSAALTLGSFTGATLTRSSYLPGSEGDLIQLDGIPGSDAEWGQVAAGANPATVFGANLAAHYALKGPADLAQTAGSRVYAACTLNGSGHLVTGPGRPVVSTVDATKSLMAQPLFRGYVHALDPVSVRGVADLAGLQALTGTVSRDVRVGGAATHIEGRVVRKSDDLVLVNWVRATVSAATGLVPVLIPGVPSIAGELRFEFRREDEPTCICVSTDDERVGLVATLGPAQSQTFIAMTDSASKTLTPNSTTLVSYCVMRGQGAAYVAPDGGYLTLQNQLSEAMTAVALYWDALATGVPLELVSLAVEGTGTTEWMYHSIADGLDLWGDGVTPSSGYATATLLAKRKRVTMCLSSWYTSDQSTYLGGSVGPMSTAYGSITVTERPWIERWNELMGGVEKSTAGAPERAQRNNLVDSSLLAFPAWSVILPPSRHNAGTSPSSAVVSKTAFRKVQYDYAETGIGKDSSVLASLGGFQLAIHMDTTSSPHQHRTDPRGNIRFALQLGHAIAHVSKASTINPRSRLTAASGVGTLVLTLTTTLMNGGSLVVHAGSVVRGIEVSIDAGATWSVFDGAVPFTPALVGNTVTLTRGSNWPSGALVRYLPGYPLSMGSLVNDALALDGTLAETRADAVPAGVSLPAVVPLMPTFTDLVAT